MLLLIFIRFTIELKIIKLKIKIMSTTIINLSQIVSITGKENVITIKLSNGDHFDCISKKYNCDNQIVLDGLMFFISEIKWYIPQYTFELSIDFIIEDGCKRQHSKNSEMILDNCLIKKVTISEFAELIKNPKQ